MTTFELIFIPKTTASFTIELENEPIGYDGADFTIKRDDKRHGIDVVFLADEDLSLEFTEHAHPEVFDHLVNFYETYGFEANVKLRITDNGESFVGNLGFDDINYNGHDHIKINVFQETEQALIKKRSSTKIDLYGSTDVDGNPSAVCPSSTILLKSKEIKVSSVWEHLIAEDVYNFSNGKFMFIPDLNTTKYDVSASLPITETSTLGNDINANMYNFEILRSKTKLTDVGINFDFNGSQLQALYNKSSGSRAVFKWVLAKGVVNSGNYTFYDVYSRDIINTPNIPTTGNFVEDFPKKTIIIDKIEQDESLFLYYYIDRWNQNLQGGIRCKNIKITIEASSMTFDTTTKAVTIYDAIKKVVRDTSGLNVSFPLAQTGYLKSHYIFTGDHVRGINNEFKLSFDEIIDWFPELNLDYEIQSNNQIFIGSFEDFYTDAEVGVYEDVTLEGFNISTNLDFTNNEFSYEYKDFQANNENSEEGSKETIHGKAVYLINNKQVESKKEVSVSFARDSFLLEKKRRDAIVEKDTTSASSDDTIFILDTATLPVAEKYINKTAFLYHIKGEYNGHEVLILRNDGSFRFDLLGIYEDPLTSFLVGNFNIATGPNAGSYRATKVSRTELILKKATGSPQGLGEVFTQFSYNVMQSISLRPNYNKVDIIEGINSPQTFVNIDFSVKQNIMKSYRDYLATCNLYNGFDLKLTEYKHNKDFVKRNLFNVVIHNEGADISTNTITPILDTKLAETTLIMTLSEYFALCNRIRSGNRGIIRTFKPNKQPLYIYPDEMVSSRKASDIEEVKLKGKLRYLPPSINITKQNGLYNIFIHKLVNKNYEFDGEKIQFFDDNMQPIYKQTHYSNITLNNTSYLTLDAFVTALQNF